MEVQQATTAKSGNGHSCTHPSVRELFCELVEFPPEERDRILAERRIPALLRAEVESLLRYDSTSTATLARYVSDCAREALEGGEGPMPPNCGPYRPIRLLGSGGMGAVYLAERQDGEVEQRVAVKLLRADADLPAWRERFLRERQLLADLNHPSIARLLDAGHTDDGRPYLVMEHVDGAAIDEYAAVLDLRGRLRLFLLVCEGVSHAHRHFVVHRDLKPPNILVDSSGRPKLLDFGIAKLLDSATGHTRTVDRLLTPDYASPEQLRGELQTTATDVYSLGAVLHTLLTGRPPRETKPHGGAKGPELPRDIRHVLAKAMRDEPEERYSSVDALADDIRAFLESRPVRARSANVWYRTGKFLRRCQVPLVALTVAAVAVFLGLITARQHRIVARARAAQIRQLAGTILSLEEVATGAHGSSRAMRKVVAMAKNDLEPLVREARTDRGLTLDAVRAYLLLARAEGICMAASADQRARAEKYLRTANRLVEPILTANPNDRKALLSAANVSHDLMVITTNDGRTEEGAAQAHQSAGYLDRFLHSGAVEPADSDTAAELFYDIALCLKNLQLPAEGIRYARLSIEYSRSSPHATLRLSLASSLLAELLRRHGDLEGALAAINESRANLDQAQFSSEQERRSAWCRILGREASIQGAPGLSLNRPDKALPLLQRVFDLLEEWAENDRDDAWSRLLFASAGRELGGTLSLHHPKRALAVYDHALLRLREVTNNAEARRGEADILTGSAYALRRLNRVDEAKNRIDAAFRLLAETKDYPADRVVPDEPAENALRAAGDHLAETGQPERAAEVYEQLLSKLMAATDIQNNLAHAVSISRIYGSLVSLHRRIGERDRAEAFSGARLELWRHWTLQLPRNRFVLRQLESAGASNRT